MGRSGADDTGKKGTVPDLPRYLASPTTSDEDPSTDGNPSTVISFQSDPLAPPAVAGSAPLTPVPIPPDLLPPPMPVKAFEDDDDAASKDDDAATIGDVAASADAVEDSIDDTTTVGDAVENAVENTKTVGDSLEKHASDGEDLEEEGYAAFEDDTQEDVAPFGAKTVEVQRGMRPPVLAPVFSNVLEGWMEQELEPLPALSGADLPAITNEVEGPTLRFDRISFPEEEAKQEKAEQAQDRQKMISSGTWPTHLQLAMR
ncbi:MAG: hypothetical protein JRH20_16285 [Deltaproteobacteria bacterium]|nr:hypothetical protein [Deltaproteobacteria bacterium]